MEKNKWALLYIGVLIMASSKLSAGEIKPTYWGEHDDQPVYLYTLEIASQMKVSVTNFGARITSILVADKNGKLDDVVLGYDNLEAYTTDTLAYGATVGRFANRIRNASFSIEGVEHRLTDNNRGNNLHGGFEFQNAVWTAQQYVDEQGQHLRFEYLSKDGSHGFPGNMQAAVLYTLTEDGELRITFSAVTDKATHINMTQHSYFNLNGAQAAIYDQQLQIDAREYLVLDDNSAPTGETDVLKGKAWDLMSSTRIGDKINDIRFNGYHHTYIFDKPLHEYKKVAELYDPGSGRLLEVSTTQPSIVLYALNYPVENNIGKEGIQYHQHWGLCLETQGYPAAPNFEHFPSTLLRPGELYEEMVVYKFGVR